MPALNWPEIRNRATRFANEWRDIASEQAEAQTFWNEFFEVFGVKRRRVAVYEKHVEKLPQNGKTKNGRIDVFWPATMLAEHKSAGADLTAAFKQALDYFEGITHEEWPRYVVVSDFQRFRLYDLDDGEEIEFKLEELPSRISFFGFIAGYSKIKVRDEDPLNIKAVQLLGELHDALKKDGYGLDETGKAGHVLQLFLVRILFCLFADDTGLFSPKDSFLELLERTKEDGLATGGLIARLFQALNTKREHRQKSLQEEFAPFPHVNGRLFEETLLIPEFNSEMRRLLLDCCRVQWANISPAIFGAMFQKVIDLDARDRRRQLGAHYTSEANIRKVIGPLFLEELRAEFEEVKHHKNKLFEFIKKLSTLNFLDPACGCGNFLVVTYRELRRLELDVLLAAKKFGYAISNVFEALQVNVDQFHGIELEEFPAQVAQVAMWLTDHQMNVEAGREFSEYFDRLPLTKSAHIRQGNALRLDWEAFIPPAKLNYILGNPPFVGKQFQTPEQKEDLETVSKGLKGGGVLDYVTGWYFKAGQYLSGGREGFVSRDKRLFEDVRFSENRKLPISGVSEIAFGSMPNDGGHLLLSDAERAALLAVEPGAATWIRPFLGSEEFIHGLSRWCLWLVDLPPGSLSSLPSIRSRIEGVRKHRLSSKRPTTNKLAKTPTLFGEIRQPDSDFLVIPEVSSERRTFIPIGFLTPLTIISNKLYSFRGASLYDFGVMQSLMHMAWTRRVAGRLKSDFQYSPGIVYNNFPWPRSPSDKHRAAIEQTAQAVLDARGAHANATLAQLYDPNGMPANLAKAHEKLDRAVDAAYVADGGARTYASDAERVAFLFRRHAELTGPLNKEHTNAS